MVETLKLASLRGETAGEICPHQRTFAGAALPKLPWLNLQGFVHRGVGCKKSAGTGPCWSFWALVTSVRLCRGM